ncbi:gamma-glutamylcyclotransferase [Amycolatopsis antarctica]
MCPSKITWLRSALGLAGPVVVLRAQCRDLAAVWAAGFRERDGQRPATIVAAPGVVERHGLWLATAEQLTTLDACEGRGVRYDLARLHSGTVTLDDGTVVPDPLVYRAAPPGPSGYPEDSRLPLLVDGAPVRCAEVPQVAAAALAGSAAPSDGLDVTVAPSGSACRG